MNRSAGTVLHLFKAFVEFSVNLAIDVIAPRPRPQAVPVIAMVDREWARAQARRRGLGRL